MKSNPVRFGISDPWVSYEIDFSNKKNPAKPNFPNEKEIDLVIIFQSPVVTIRVI